VDLPAPWWPSRLEHVGVSGQSTCPPEPIPSVQRVRILGGFAGQGMRGLAALVHDIAGAAIGLGLPAFAPGLHEGSAGGLVAQVAKGRCAV
jgi:hypothetical protein